MIDPQRTENMRVLLDVHQCRLTEGEVQKMRAGLDGLGALVKNFPVADLHVLVEHNARTTDYSVKTSLVLPGATLVCSERDPLPYTAFERCVSSLEASVKEYKARMGGGPEVSKQEKGTRQELEPTLDPDPDALNRALDEGDYAAFREALVGYEETVRKRVGRWVERNPEAQARIGNGGRPITIADVVEEVFLDAFENFARRPQGVRFGEWLDGLIDPAIKELLTHTDAELENVRLARTLRGVPASREEH